MNDYETFKVLEKGEIMPKGYQLIPYHIVYMTVSSISDERLVWLLEEISQKHHHLKPYIPES
jgi:hypothetical protein